MSRLPIAALIAVFASVGLAAQATSQPAPKTTPKADAAKKDAAKETRLEGVIVRQSQADSTLTIHRRWTSNEERTVVYNNATKWTKTNKPAEMSLFKDGQQVVVLGKLDDKGRLVASRIELRAQ